MERKSLHPHVPEMETLYLHVESEAACDAEYMYYSPPVEYITSSAQPSKNDKNSTFCGGNTLTLSSAQRKQFS